MRPHASRQRLPQNWAMGPLPVHPSLRVSALGFTFQEIGVGASLWVVGGRWHPIHNTASRDATAFELELDAWGERVAHNERMLMRAQRDRSLVIGKHAGFMDAFVPILHADGLEAVLVVGPFTTERPTSFEVQKCWQTLSGLPGKLSDPVFSRYLSTTLGMLTLEGGLLDAFRAFLESFAKVLGGRPGDDSAARDAQRHGALLGEARFAERMWEQVRRLVEERGTQPPAPIEHGTLAAFRLKRTPEHVVCGLLSEHGTMRDPIANVIQRSAFQRECVEFTRKLGGAIAGRIGDRGVVFLVEAAGSQARIQARLSDVAAKAAIFARRFGLELRAGIGNKGRESLAARYRSALAAAEKALSQSQRLVIGAPEPANANERLREQRKELSATVSDPAELLSPRFERYVETVLGHSGFRLEVARAELDHGIECMVEPLLSAGVLDRRSHDELLSTLARSSESASSVADAVAAYRQAVSEVEAALRRPVVARHDRALDRALRHVRDHLTEPLSVPEVARVAGFAPSYFSRQFKREQGVTFVRYVLKLRIERAQQMLEGTELSVDQIQRLCGFRTRAHFYWGFSKLVGVAPNAYRQGAGGP